MESEAALIVSNCMCIKWQSIMGCGHCKDCVVCADRVLLAILILTISSHGSYLNQHKAADDL